MSTVMSILIIQQQERKERQSENLKEKVEGCKLLVPIVCVCVFSVCALPRGPGE